MERLPLKRSKDISSMAMPGKAEYVDADVGTMAGGSKSSSGCFIFLTEAGSTVSSREGRLGGSVRNLKREE